MRVLLHICCAPCAIFPIDVLTNENMDVSGFWFNPNIQPYLEYRKRLIEVRRFLGDQAIPLIEEDEYMLDKFLKSILSASEELNRCTICYDIRLRKTAEIAALHEFDAFTTTLLYSKYQNHEYITQLCEKLAQNFGVKFLYRDFREGWSKGIKVSRKLGLYRQQYCGCIFSEFERFRNCADSYLEKTKWNEKAKN